MWLSPNSEGYIEWAIDPSVQALVSTREAGYSSPPFDQGNLSLTVGDEQDAVEANRRQAAAWLGADLGATIWPQQVHAGEIGVVGWDQAGRGSRSTSDAMAGVDGLISNDPRVVLSLLFADCVPIFLADLDHGWIGLVHSGWRGTALNISGQAVSRLAERGVVAGDLWAGIGPAIGVCCYEVDQVVIDAVGAAGASSIEGFARKGRPGHYFLDMAAINRRLLLQAGIRAERIETLGLCTACETQRFFSHRRDHGQTGRMAGFIRRR